MTTIGGNRGQLWTSALSPHLLSPHLDFPDTSHKKNRNLAILQELSGDPNPHYFLKSTCRTMGGVLQYKWELYCWGSPSSRLRSQEGAAIQMGDVLPYTLEVYCSTFSEASRGWGF